MAEKDTKFIGPVPDIYDRFMVPMLFEPYAVDMAARVAAIKPSHVLETAAGSGVTGKSRRAKVRRRMWKTVSTRSASRLDKLPCPVRYRTNGSST